MASLMDNLIRVLEKENAEYERLLELSTEKVQIIIDGNIPALEAVTSEEQDVTSNIKNFDNKREEIIGDMAIVLSKDPEDLTITNMIAFLNQQPKEQQRLQEVQSKLKGTLQKIVGVNQQNELLIQQAMEMVEFDLTLLTSMRQAPTTANYNKHAYNTGDVLGDAGFDAKQ